LARLDAAVALSKVTARFPQARLAREPQYKPNLTLRGMASLEVAFYTPSRRNQLGAKVRVRSTKTSISAHLA
jgi:hypothetical protein